MEVGGSTNTGLSIANTLLPAAGSGCEQLGWTRRAKIVGVAASFLSLDSQCSKEGVGLEGPGLHSVVGCEEDPECS